MKIGLADYGLMVWDGAFYDRLARLEQLGALGFEGYERLEAVSAADAVEKAARFRAMGMDFATCRGPNVAESIRWTAAIGKPYVWVAARSARSGDFDVFCRQARAQAEASKRWGVETALHNHLGALVESQDELEAFMEACPECKLVFDVGHLAGAGGDPLAIIDKYAGRIVALHLSDFCVTDPEIGLESWPQRGHFCTLGEGNVGLDHPAIVRALVKAGYDGWLFIEHAHHRSDPLDELKADIDLIKSAL
jgi:sugar phosphate isomerase/epimerase